MATITGGLSPGIPGGGAIPGGGIPLPSLAPPWDFVVLLSSIIILIISLFLLSEAVKTQKYFLNEEKVVSLWGEVWCWIISLLIIVLWVHRTVLVTLLMGPSFMSYGMCFFDGFLFQPREYAPGFLLASLLPTSVGLLKLLTVVAAPQRRVPGAWGVALVKIIFNLLTAVASIVTLIKLLRP